MTEHEEVIQRWIASQKPPEARLPTIAGYDYSDADPRIRLAVYDGIAKRPASTWTDDERQFVAVMTHRMLKQD